MTLGHAAGAVLACFGLAGAASAQDMAAFTQADRAATRYTAAPVHPAVSCADLLNQGGATQGGATQGGATQGGGMTVLSATAIPAADGVPAHCRVDGLIAPEIAVQVNLPDNWNRRFYMFGNGGYAGETADTPPKPLYRAHALAAGFATAWTNTGHDARREPLGSFAASRAKLVDYAFRAVHLATVAGKRLAGSYYGQAPATAYWDGCSTGGRQGLMEAQRFPLDFDGVLAGAPVERFVDSQVAGLWNGRAVSGSGLTVDKMKAVGQAAYAKCADPSGVIADPRRCGFDPARDVRRCSPGTDDASCLTERQATAVAAVYNGVRSNGVPAFFGYAVGAEGPGASFTGQGRVESGWDEWLIGRNNGASRQQAYGESFLRDLVDPGSGLGTTAAGFDFDAGPGRLGALRALLDADNPDLSAFRRHGGKLILYHGWADTALTPLMTLDYFARARARNAPGADDFLRLYMVPGMAHCAGGLATDRFDAMTSLVDWVESGVAPGPVEAERRGPDGTVDRTRPLCPHPQEAVYDGSGDVNAAASYACRVVHQ